MGRANSYDRSLIIISKQQGWDPTKIEGGPDMAATFIHRETPFVTDSKPIAGVDSAQNQQRTQGPDTKDWKAPEPRSSKPHRSKNANPFPEMPGSR